MLRLVALAALTTGCLSGTHLAKGTLYETRATAHTAWKAMDGSWPALRHRTQALAISMYSPWGVVSPHWSDGQPHTYALLTDDHGPYGVIAADGKPLALGRTMAAVVDLDFTAGTNGDVVLHPSAVRVVDSARAVRALDDAAARWKTYVADQQPAIDRALDEAGHASPGRPLGVETTGSADGFMPTWVPADQRFVIVYVRTTARSSELVERHEPSPCGKYNVRNLPGFPEEPPVRVACPPPHVEVRVHRRSYSADVALVLEYNADGSLSFERRYAPDPMPAKGPY